MRKQFMLAYFFGYHYEPIDHNVLVMYDMLLCSTTIQQYNAYR